MSLFDPDADLQLSDASMDIADNQTESSDTGQKDTLGSIPEDLGNLRLVEDEVDGGKDGDSPQREDTDTGDGSDQMLSDENDIRSQVGSDTQSDTRDINTSPEPSPNPDTGQSTPLHPYTPSDIPQTQKQLLELQHQAAKFSLSLDRMLLSMQHSLMDITSISLRCTQLYRETIDDTCLELDGSIKSMYMIMTKCEVLEKQGEAVDRLAKEVHDINIKLQHLERLFNK